MSSKLHIVIACPGCGMGTSVGNDAIKHARELSKYFDVSLVSDNFPSNLSATVCTKKVSPWRFNWLRRFCHVPNEYAFVRCVYSCLERLHREQRIDILLCHGHTLATLVGRHLKQKYGIPYILATHGDIFDRPKGTYDPLLMAFYKLVTPVAYRDANLVLALSPDIAARAIADGAEKSAVVVVPNGVDPDDIGLDSCPIRIKLPRCQDNISPIRLLYVGRFSVEKGIQTLIAACKLLKLRGVIFKLNLIGDGPLRSQLENMVLVSELSKDIFFLGKLEKKYIGRYYQDADLLCVPSLSEPLATVAIEALIAGTLVLGSNIGGTPFILENGKSGVLVPPSSPEAMATAIQKLTSGSRDMDFLKRPFHKICLYSVFLEFNR